MRLHVCHSSFSIQVTAQGIRSESFDHGFWIQRWILSSDWCRTGKQMPSARQRRRWQQRCLELQYQVTAQLALILRPNFCSGIMQLSGARKVLPTPPLTGGCPVPKARRRIWSARLPSMVGAAWFERANSTGLQLSTPLWHLGGWPELSRDLQAKSCRSPSMHMTTPRCSPEPVLGLFHTACPNGMHYLVSWKLPSLCRTSVCRHLSHSWRWLKHHLFSLRWHKPALSGVPPICVLKLEIVTLTWDGANHCCYKGQRRQSRIGHRTYSVAAPASLQRNLAGTIANLSKPRDSL